ncbi:MAG TPA: hypothetical protein VLA56_20950 [Pseudomonadales bacterium]|nr:hypothetical protein [Pseudomonadales bacterium]
MKEQRGCLDGTTLEYVHGALGTVRVAYAAGKVAFEWIAVPMVGEKGSGLDYRAIDIIAGAARSGAAPDAFVLGAPREETKMAWMAGGRDWPACAVLRSVGNMVSAVSAV